jgi:1,4-dihydroxy-2-naphthoate octaprenyltransferase
MAGLRRFLLHLRLPFNYVLSPLFVWGAVVAEGRLDLRFWIGFVAFHLFLYGGTNMFNSYWDRDEGPIGGLAHPPAVDRSLLWGSLGLKAGGLFLALWIGGFFIGCYLFFVLYSICYSHPAIRLKRRPVGSAISVFFGQGVVGFLGGWFASGGELAALGSTPAWQGGLAAALLVSALYPLTQVYQLDEDAHRGDLTLARWLGSPAVFAYIGTLFVPGVLLATWVFRARGAVWAGWATLALLPLAALALWEVRRSLGRLPPEQLYRRAMGFQYLNATALLVVMAGHLA